MKIATATPVFLVADIPATIRWYEANLGFTARALPDFAILNRDDIEIMLQRLPGYAKPDLYDQREGGVWSVYFRVDGVDEFFRSLPDAVEVVEPLHTQPYGQREFVVRDPNGYTLVFAEPAV